MHTTISSYKANVLCVHLLDARVLCVYDLGIMAKEADPNKDEKLICKKYWSCV